MEDCLGKPDRYDNCKILRKAANETVENHVTSTWFSIDCIDLQTDCALNKPLHMESAKRYRHHLQVMMEFRAFNMHSFDFTEVGADLTRSPVFSCKCNE
jgi:hypothetical protein